LSAASVEEYRDRLAGIPFHLVVLDPGRERAARRDATRPKSQRHVEQTGISIAARWAHLEDEMRSELPGLGLWLNNADLTVEQTLQELEAHRDEALVS
jgi:hypothetical protein